MLQLLNSVGRSLLEARGRDRAASLARMFSSLPEPSEMHVSHKSVQMLPMTQHDVYLLCLLSCSCPHRITLGQHAELAADRRKRCHDFADFARTPFCCYHASASGCGQEYSRFVVGGSNTHRTRAWCHAGRQTAAVNCCREAQACCCYQASIPTF